MTEWVVKTSVKKLIRDVTYDRLMPQDILIDGQPATSKEEAITALQTALASGVTAL